MYSSFGYFEDPADDLRLCRNVFRMLRPGGSFLIETMSKEVLARIFQPNGWREIDGEFLLEERKVDPGWTALHQRWVLIRRGRVREFPVFLRLYSGTELGDLLRRAGFRRVELYGSMELTPYDNTARRMVAVGHR